MNIQKIWLGLMVLGMSGIAQAASLSYSCTTTREYITALEYMRDHKEFNLAEPEAQKIATQVAQGCTGAAQRMIRISLQLSQAGMGGRDALEMGMRFTKRSDQEVETFGSIFRRAFASDGLDLDLRASTKMAEELTRDFEADTIAVRDDFEKLLDFCATSSKLGLPKPQCGGFAARLAKKGEKWSGGISMPFIQAFEFVVSDKGPALATSKAIDLADRLITAGPGATDNFIAAYRYAINKKGLGLADNAAVEFALKLGLQSGGGDVASGASPAPSK